MTTITFRPNTAGIEEIKRSREMVDALGELANAIADEAQALAPVLSGDLAGGYDADAGIEDGEAVGRVAGSDFKAGLYEFGSANNEAVAPLRRGAEAVGLDVKAS